MKQFLSTSRRQGTRGRLSVLFSARLWLWLLALTGLPLLSQAANPTLVIRGVNPSGGDNTAFVDQVEIVRSADNVVMAGAVANAGFETASPAVAAGTFTYLPTGASWVFNDTFSGIARNGSGFGAPTAPEGTAVSMVQMGSSIQQTLALAPGTYYVRFWVAQRNCCSATNNQQLNVLVNGNSVGTVQPVNNGVFTQYSSGTFTVAAAPGNALAFDGVGDHVALPNTAPVPVGNSSYTIEAWIRPTALGDYGIIGWGNYGTNSQVNALRLHAGGLINYWWSNDLVVNTAILVNRWQHVAATYSAGTNTRTIYVNGVSVGSDNPPAGSHAVPNANNLRIGSTNNGEFFPGSIDEVRVYNTALTAAQLQADMVSTSAALPGNLNLYFDFDQGTAGGSNAGVTTAYSQVNNVAGTLQGPFALTGTASNWVESYAMVRPTTTAATANTGTGFTANWTAPAVGIVSSYSIELSTSPTFASGVSPFAVAAGTTSRVFTGLTPGVTYYYRVRADKTSVSNQGAFSNTTSALVAPCAVTAVAQNVAAALAANGTVTVTAAQVDNGSSSNCGTVTLGLLDATERIVNGNFDTDAASWTGVNIDGNGGYRNPGGNPGGFFLLNWNGTAADPSLAQTVTGLTVGTTYALRGTYRTFDGAGNPGNGLAIDLDNVQVKLYPATPSGAWQPFYYTFTASATSHTIRLRAEIGNDFNAGIDNISLRAMSTSRTYTCANLGANPVTLFAADNSASSIASATVTVSDNMGPTVVTQNISVQLSAAGTASITAAQVNNGSSDNCTPAGSLTLSVSPSSFTCANAATSTGNQYALDFDGGNDFVNLGGGNILTGGSYTKEAWVFSRDNNCRNILSANNQHQLWLQSGNLHAGNANAYSTVIDPTGAFPLNTWVHVAVTYDQPTSTMRLYRNGTLVATNTAAAAYTGGPIQIGAHGSGCFFNGRIEEVRIWNSARSAAQIGATKDVTLAGNEAGLLAYYNFENGPNSGTLTDVSGNGRTGTLVNMAPATAWVASTAPITASNPTSVTLTVTDANGNSSTGTAQVSVIAPPAATISSLNPASAGAGAVVTVTGTNLSGATALTVNGATAAISNLTATSFTFVVPNGAAASGNVVVTLPCSQTVSSPFTVMAAPGNALAFDGGNDLVTIPHSSAFNITTAITLEAWVRTSLTTGAEQYITTKNNDSWYLAVNGGGGPLGVASFFLNNISPAGGGWLYGTTNLTDGRWHHVAGTYDGATLRLYVDGVLENSRSATGTIPTGTAPIFVGSRAGSLYWNGSIDELRIHNQALTLAQVRADMVSTSPSPGLVAYFNFDQGTPGGNNAGLTTLYDRSGTYAATLSNFTLTGTTSNWVESYAMVLPTPTAATAITGTGFTANWTAPAIGTANSYFLDVATNPTFTAGLTTFSVSAPATSFAVTGRTPATQYYYRVRANKTTVANQGGARDNTPVTTLSNVATLSNLTLSAGALSPAFASNTFGYSVATTGTSTTVTPTVTQAGATVTVNGTAVASGSASASLPLSIGANNISVVVTAQDGTTTSTYTVTVTRNCVVTAVAQNITVNLNASGTVSVPATSVNNGSSSTCAPVTVGFQTQGTVGAMVNEGQTLSLTAPAGATFTAVTFASYGTPTGSSGSFAYGSCHGSNSKAVVEGFLLGNGGTINIPANNATFGDPCPFTPKRLAVQATYTFGSPVTQLNYTCANIGANNVTLTVTDVNGNFATAAATITVQDNTAPVFVTCGTGTAADPYTNLNCVTGIATGTYWFNIGGSTFQGYVDGTTDGGGWVEILNYVHQGGTNPALNARTTSLPVQTAAVLGANESGTAAWGHAAPSLVNTLSPLEVRFYGQTSAHARVIHFKTSLASVLSYLRTGTGSMSNLGAAGTFTALPGHSANLPAATDSWFSNQGSAAATEFPFYRGGTFHWGIRGLGNRWEVDDYPNNEANSTIHRMFVRGSTSAATGTPVVVSNTTGQCGANVTLTGSQTVTDNCSTPTVTFSPASGSFFNVGTTPVTATATDAAGNSSTSTFTVTVNDTQAPTITCPAAVASCSNTPALGTPTTSDNCAVASVTNNAPNPFPLGTTTVTWTVTDVNGLTATCTQSVTVNSIPAAPTAPNVSRCGPGTVTLVASGAPAGGSYAWYTAATGGTPVATTASYTTPSLSSSTTYYVSARNAAANSSCESATRTAVVALIAPVPAPVITPAGPTTFCQGGNVSLTASNPASGTGGYTVAAATYAPLTVAGATNGPSGDDALQVVTLPFPFSFYGATYTSTTITTNGNIQFGNNTSNAWTASAIPNTALPNAYVALAWSDWVAAAGQISYFTTGTAPNRRFVVNYNGLTPYQGTGGGVLTGQIILHEGTNLVELQLTTQSNTARTKVQGLENINGNGGLAVTGRNLANWQASNDAQLFTPTSAATYAWSPATGLSATNTATVTASPTTTTTYTVTLTEGGCSNTANVTITVPTPAAPTTTSASRCGAGSVTLSAAGAPAGGSYAWYTVATGGTPIAGETASTYTTPSLSSTTTYYVSVLNAPANSSCESTRTAVTATINPVPTPTITASGPTTFCPGGSVTLTANNGPASSNSAFLNAPNAGGSQITCNCPPGYVAVGYTGRTGAWMDRAQLACKQLNADGTLGAAVVYTTPNGWSTGGNTNGPYILPPNQVLVGAMVTTASGFVTGLQGFGQTTAYVAGSGVNNAGATALGIMTGSAGSSLGTVYAPNGMVITGMRGWNTQYTTGFSFTYQPIATFLDTYAWSNGATTPSITVTTSGSYTVTVTNSQGCSATSAPTTVTVTPTPSAPTATGGSRCGAGSVALSAAGAPAGGTYAWYTVATGGTAIAGQTASTYNTPSLTTTTNYYVSVRTSAASGSCESPRTIVTATINSFPAAPTTTSASRCDAGSVTLSAAGAPAGGSYAWYTVATGGTPIAGETASTYTTPSLSSTTTYYVSVLNAPANSSCESTRTAVTATINSAPAFTACPGNQTAPAATGSCSAAVSYTATVSGMPASTITYAFTGATTGSGTGTGSGSTFLVGTTTVTITAANGCAPDATCSFTVTVNDTQAPIVVTQNISVNLDASGNASITAAQVNNGSSDNCTPAASLVLSVSPASFTCANVGTPVTVTLTVTDAAGNSSTGTATVTVNDVTAPTTNTLPNAPALALSNVPEAAGYGVLYQLNIPNAANFNGLAAVPYTVNNSGVSMPTPARVAYFMEVEQGGVSKWVWASMNNFAATLPQLGIPHPTQNPVSWNQNVTGLNVFSSANAGVVTGSNLGTGRLEMWRFDYGTNNANAVPGASNSTYDFGDQNVGNSNYGSFQVHNVTAAQTLFAYNNWGSNGGNSDLGIGNQPSGHPDWTFTNNAGTYTVKRLYILVPNSSAPGGTFTQPATVQLNASGNATVTTAQVYLGNATDNCSAVTASVTPSSFTCANVGPNTVTVTVADASGNSTSQTTTVTVVDNMAPAVVAQNSTVNLSAAGTVTVTASSLNNGSTDACGPLTYEMTNTTEHISNGTFNASATGWTPTNVDGAGGYRNPGGNPGGYYLLNSNGQATDPTITQTVTGLTVGARYLLTGSYRTFDGVGNTGSTGLAVNINGTQVRTYPVTTAAWQTFTHVFVATATSNTFAIRSEIGNDFNAGVDNISVRPIVSSVTYTCANVGVNPTWLIVTDANSNMGLAAATVTVVDNMQPTAIAQNVTATVGASGRVYVSPASVNNGSSDNCTVTNVALSASTFGDCGASSALLFDGVDDYVVVAPHPAFNVTNSITLEAWVRTSSTGEQYITTKMENSWYLAVNGAGGAPGRLSFFLNNVSTSSGGWLHGTTSIADGTWHHVAGTYDGATLRLYVDGVQQNSRAVVNTIPTGTSPVLIGARPGQPWNGQLDEVRIWNVARTAADIALYRDKSLAGNTAGLLAYFDMNETAGSATILNRGSVGGTGTLTNYGTTTSTAFVGPGMVPALGTGAQTVTMTVSDASGNVSTTTATVNVSVPVLTTTTWNGNASTDWTDCRNWSQGVLPSATVSAMVPGGMLRYPVLPAGTFPTNDITLANGVTLTLGSATTLQVYGNWTNDNAGTTLGGSVTFLGTANQSIRGSQMTNFNNVLVTKPTGTTLQLLTNATVGGQLTVNSGLVNTGSLKVFMNPNATITESETAYVIGNVETTRLVNTAGSAVTFGGLGLTLQPAAGSTTLPGSTRVIRTTGTAVTGVNGSVSIQRYFDIQATVNSGLNVNMTFGYFEHELNGIGEGNLALFKSGAGLGGQWTPMRYITRNAAANTVYRPAITSFSIWTLGNDANPLPVELLTFTARKQGTKVQLDWRTATERNSSHFEVERSRDGRSFERIGQVAAQGNSTSPTDYALTDANYPGETNTLYYRLKQVDLDGTFSYSPVRTVQLGKALATLEVYPNPAKADVMVLGVQAGASVEVFDALGRAIVQAKADANGTVRLSLPDGTASGVYLVKSGNQTKRLTVE